jgi:hypothetical protein
MNRMKKTYKHKQGNNKPVNRKTVKQLRKRRTIKKNVVSKKIRKSKKIVILSGAPRQGLEHYNKGYNKIDIGIEQMNKQDGFQRDVIKRDISTSIDDIFKKISDIIMNEMIEIIKSTNELDDYNTKEYKFELINNVKEILNKELENIISRHVQYSDEEQIKDIIKNIYQNKIVNIVKSSDPPSFDDKYIEDAIKDKHNIIGKYDYYRDRCYEIKYRVINYIKREFIEEYIYSRRQ